MQAVILAGGLGTRLSEETSVRPKPMVEVGGMPLLWHILKGYSTHGIDDFVICLGYKGHLVKEYFASYYLHRGDVTFDLAKNTLEVHRTDVEPWRVTLLETGNATMTGGRLKRALEHVTDDVFCMTYGDGVADVDVGASIAFHRAQGTLATMTAVRPQGRFGALGLDGDRIASFAEKPAGDGGWVNGGFFVLDRRIGDYIAGDQTTWEREPLEHLARDRELACFQHAGFWQPVDTLRDLVSLQELWDQGHAPWRTWP